jgi:hypothetical protein
VRTTRSFDAVGSIHLNWILLTVLRIHSQREFILQGLAKCVRPIIALKPTLNVGCGQDDWGEVRVDVSYATQTGIKSRLNVRADARFLPFRDASFSFSRCWHVIEHIDHPQLVLLELRRTSEKFDVRFPVDEGYYMQLLIGVLNQRYDAFINAYRTLKRRAHLWRVSPDFVGKVLGDQAQATISDRYLEYPVPRLLMYGRKGRFFRPLLKPLQRRYYFEWRVEV